MTGYEGRSVVTRCGQIVGSKKPAVLARQWFLVACGFRGVRLVFGSIRTMGGLGYALILGT